MATYCQVEVCKKKSFKYVVNFVAIKFKTTLNFLFKIK